MLFKGNPKKRLPELRAAFLDYCRSGKLLPEETSQPPLFFNAPPVRDYISLGAANNELLPEIVASLAAIESMNTYRGALCGYLIGLYGESGVSDPQTDLALGRFYLRLLGLAEAYIKLALGHCPEISPADFWASEEAQEELAARLPELDPVLLAMANPEAALCWQGFEPLSFGVMSRLAGSRRLREWLRRQDTEGSVRRQCELLGNYREAVGFIPYMLRLAEEERLLLIAPAAGAGVEVEARQIDSNNQFFTLLQFALYHEGLLEKLGAAEFRYQPGIEKAARHLPQSAAEQQEQTAQPAQLVQQGCFGYYTYPAWHGGDYNETEPVWGEGGLYEIPRLEGRLVILLTRPRILRSWGGAFICGTHSGLRPSVRVLRELAAEEVQSWLAKIRAANGDK